jgi:hypothetical protein
MYSWDDRTRSPRARGAARQVAHAVAERERGRRRLNAATATVGFASVVAAGAVAAVLPGSTHAAATSPGSTRAGSSSAASGASGGGTANSGSSSSGGSQDNSNSSNSSSNLQAPASVPVQSNGGGQATSGGSSGW